MTREMLIERRTMTIRSGVEGDKMRRREDDREREPIYCDGWIQF